LTQSADYRANLNDELKARQQKKKKDNHKSYNVTTDANVITAKINANNYVT